MQVPRAILADLSPDTIDPIKTSPIGFIFRPSNYIIGHGKTGTQPNQPNFLAKLCEVKERFLCFTQKVFSKC